MSLLDDVKNRVAVKAGGPGSTWGTIIARLPVTPYGTLPTPPATPPETPPPVDPLTTLAAAYMASAAGGATGTAPIVIPPNPDSGAGVNWTMIGALAALALIGWAVWTWWKDHHRKGHKP